MGALSDRSVLNQIVVKSINVSEPSAKGEVLIGRGTSVRFNGPEFAYDITPEFIKSAVRTLLSTIDVPKERYDLRYTLSVRAFTKVSAKAKTKTFVRFKNPFEPTLTDVEGVSKEVEKSDGVQNFYKVDITVQKR